MKKISHLTLSFTISLFIFKYIFNYHILTNIFYSFLVAILSPIPDIDIKILNKSAKITKSTFYIFYPIHIINKIIFKHRGITHSLWIPILLTSIIYFNIISIYYINQFIIITNIAIILHIIEDSLTKTGTTPLYPIPIKIKIPIFNTKSEIHFIIIEIINFSLIVLFTYLNI